MVFGPSAGRAFASLRGGERGKNGAKKAQKGRDLPSVATGSRRLPSPSFDRAGGRALMRLRVLDSPDGLRWLSTASDGNPAWSRSPLRSSTAVGYGSDLPFGPAREYARPPVLCASVDCTPGGRAYREPGGEAAGMTVPTLFLLLSRIHAESGCDRDIFGTRG
jgi:hypothetical protein